MTELHAALALRVDAWRAAGYPHDRYPAIAEILQFAIQGEDPDAPYPATGNPGYLRAAQFRALETYWYLRLCEGTPHIAPLYERLFPATTDRLRALGLDAPDLKDIVVDAGFGGLMERITRDDALARRHKLDALRETLALRYPSYILALAMGAGKTVLIGTIVATEFALALEYPGAAEADQPFIETRSSSRRVRPSSNPSASSPGSHSTVSCRRGCTRPSPRASRSSTPGTGSATSRSPVEADST